jgi:hypothetical protein
MNAYLKHSKFHKCLMGLLVAGCTTATPASTATPVSTRLPSSAPTAAPGTPFRSPAGRAHFIADGSRGGVAITITLPSVGWSGERDEWHVEGPGGFDPPEGSGIISFTVDEEFYVYGDPCNWQSTRPDSPATTADEIVEALVAQASRSPSAPERITTNDGRAGQRLTLHMPVDLVLSDCDEGTFAMLGVAGEDPALWAQGSREIDEILIVDVDGRIALLEGGYYEATPQDDVDELHAILDSATFD